VNHRLLWRVARYSFAVAGIAFTVVALWQTWDRSRESLLPDGVTLLLAAALVIAGLTAAGRSWLVLFSRGPAWRLLGNFYLAQLGKYIPGGGLWQAAGQVGMATAAGYQASRVAGNFAVHAVIQFAAGAALVGLLILNGTLPFWMRFAAGLGLLAPVLLHRSWMSVVLRRLAALARLDLDELAPPDQATILRSWAWAVACLMSYGLAYALMFDSLGTGTDIVYSIVAFSLAWAIGFALVIFPGGLGAREAALIILVGGSTAAVLAASVALRLIAILGELTLVVVTRAQRA
jgi:hypothetical protein